MRSLVFLPNKLKYKLILAGFLFFMGNIVAGAEVIIPVPPPSVEAGAINRPLENPEKLLIEKDEDKGSIDSSGISEEKPNNKKIDARIKINNIEFTENEIFKPEEIMVLSSELVAREVTINEIYEFIEKITAICQEKGFLTSFAYLPPQKFEEGVIKIAIFQGKIGNVTVKGNKWARTNYVTKNLLGINPEEQGLFNVNHLREGLDNINSRDYLKGSITLERGEKPETTDISVDIKDRIPLGLDVSWNNHGRELIGRQRAGISVTHDNLTGYGDSLTSGTILANGTFGTNAQYRLPIGSKGDELSFLYSHSRVKLDGDLYRSYDIRGNSSLYSMGIVHPLYKKRNLRINSEISYDFKNSETTARQPQFQMLDNYELQVLRTSINITKQDSSGRWHFDNFVSCGLSNDNFVKFNSSLVRIHRLPFGSMGIFRLSGQYSPVSLVASEQFQVGGVSTVRGFKEGFLLGDNGYNVSLQVITPVPFMPDILKNKIKTAIFYDQAYARAIYQGQTSSYKNFLQAVGCGLRIYITKYLTASLDLGIPLGRDRESNQDRTRFHFYVSSDI